MPDAKPEYAGILFIGDPHLASRVPGYRRDDYPRTILGKLSWCFDYAKKNKLLPAILGDLFHWPRDNANWLMAELLALLAQPNGEVIAIYGNHDVATNELGDDDSLQVVLRARRLTLIEPEKPWQGTIGGRRVIIGGTSWAQRIPETFEPSDFCAPGLKPLVFWMAHHNIRFDESSGSFSPFEISGVDALINGHIHAPAPAITKGCTTWLNPGNISRVTYSDSSRGRTPSVLRINVNGDSWDSQVIKVPHERFADVFHSDVVKAVSAENVPSLFVSGLNELGMLRTQGGNGLLIFLEKNMHRYPPEVQAQIQSLAKEVIPDGKVET
jgi:predicted phosphodiesterase